MFADRPFKIVCPPAYDETAPNPSSLSETQKMKDYKLLSKEGKFPNVYYQ